MTSLLSTIREHPSLRLLYQSDASHNNRFLCRDKIASDASDAEKEANVKKFQEIAQAYEVLSDDETRAKYDRGEDVTGNPQSQQQQSPHGFPRGFHSFQHGGRFHFHFRNN